MLYICVSKIGTALSLSSAQAKEIFSFTYIRLFLSAKAGRVLQGATHREVCREVFRPSIYLVRILPAFAVFGGHQ